MLSHDLNDEGLGESPNLDHLFTPERMAEIDAVIAEVDSGNFLTEEQMQAYFAQMRIDWDRKKKPQ